MNSGKKNGKEPSANMRFRLILEEEFEGRFEEVFHYGKMIRLTATQISNLMTKLQEFQRQLNDEMNFDGIQI